MLAFLTFILKKYNSTLPQWLMYLPPALIAMATQFQNPLFEIVDWEPVVKGKNKKEERSGIGRVCQAFLGTFWCTNRIFHGAYVQAAIAALSVMGQDWADYFVYFDMFDDLMARGKAIRQAVQDEAEVIPVLRE